VATARLRSADFEVPQVLVSADDVSAGKPAREGYQQAAHRLGVDSADALVIEDAPAGIAAGKAAGMTVLAVGTTHPREALADADAVVDNLESVSIVLEGSGLVLVTRQTAPDHY
jgi:sugar-phosphatase